MQFKSDKKVGMGSPLQVRREHSHKRVIEHVIIKLDVYQYLLTFLMVGVRAYKKTSYSIIPILIVILIIFAYLLIKFTKLGLPTRGA